MQNIVKVSDRNGEKCWFLKYKLPTISDVRTKKVIFVGPKVRKLINDPGFGERLNEFVKLLHGKHFKMWLTTSWKTISWITTENL